MYNALQNIEIDGHEPAYSGKVREVFDLGDRLLIVATDRLSAFDCILPTGIPGKGKVLSGLSSWWFRALEGVMPTHFITDRVEEYPQPFCRHPDLLAGRSMLVRRARRIDIECVVRGYLAGSGWKEYQAGGAVCGVPLPAGLVEADRLPGPIFTPALKNDAGHDENVPWERARAVAGPGLDEARRLSLALYRNLARYMEPRGIILADTKFEFGLIGGQVALIDEVASPDSSRFWDATRYAPGRSPDSFDKQFVRDWLLQSGWNMEPPAPALPREIVARTVGRYEEAARRLIDEAHPLRFLDWGWQWS